jgi:hypothetical protein
VELQTLAPVVEVAYKALVGHRKRDIFTFTPFFRGLRGLRGFVVEQSITFHHVQSRRVWPSIPVNHRKRPDFDPYSVDHERVAFVMADGIPIPRRRYPRRMHCVQPYAANFMIVGGQGRTS